MASKKCTICNDRPVSQKVKRENPDFDYCLPCMTLSEMENQHSDDDHDGIEAGTFRFARTFPKSQRADWLARAREAMGNCWVCHPELDQTQAAYQARNGSSRKGMVINVPLRGTPQEKADRVKALLSKDVKRSSRGGAPIASSTEKGITRLIAHLRNGDLVLAWDERGRYLYSQSRWVPNGASSEADTVKARNVAHALRLVQGE